MSERKPINPYADWSDYDWEEAWEEFLNECHPTVTICGYDYDPAQALRGVDPIAYRCGFNDWQDGVVADVENGEYGWEDEH